jgi:hypothetical protein
MESLSKLDQVRMAIMAKIKTEIACDIPKLVKKADELFVDVCRRYCTELVDVSVNPRTVSMEVLAALIEKYPEQMMALK